MTDFEAKRERALKLLDATGIRRSNYCPPLLRLLWRLGVQAPPPHFAGFGATAGVAGAFFAVVWGSIMWFVMWRSTGLSPTSALLAAVSAGALFGLFMSAYYAYGRKKHKLPDWDSLNTPSAA